MRAICAVAVLGLFVGVAIAASGGAPAGAADKDCSDFSNQAEAQRFFINHGGPSSDPHRLDADNDGIACESNPCPCDKGTGGGGGGGGGGQKPQKPKTVKKTKTVKTRAKITGFADGAVKGQVRSAKGLCRRARNVTVFTYDEFGDKVRGKSDKTNKRGTYRVRATITPGEKYKTTVGKKQVKRTKKRGNVKTITKTICKPGASDVGVAP